MAAACEQFQSLLMRKMHRNAPQQQQMLAETAETLIQQVLAAREDDIVELDEYSKEILNGLLNELRDKINLHFQQQRQDLQEAKEEKVRLQALLQEVNDKLQTALTDNADIKTELHELVHEVMAKDSEHQAQLGESKSEAAAARKNVQQLERQRSKVQQLLQHYDIKLRQAQEQKLLCAHQLAREQGKRRNLEAKLVEVQEQLVQLSLKYQKIERSYDEISHSLESREEKIKHLNKIIEESEYLSSLSPHSRRKIDTQISEEEDKSYNSQHSHKIKKTLNQEEIPLIRLSQSYLPNEKSFKSISLSIEEKQEAPEQQVLPKSKERIEIVSQRKNAKKGTKLVHSHQKKPSKEVLSLKKEIEKPKTNVALSKKECSNAVKSKLSSIFKDRMQYRSENEDKFEKRLEDLKERIKEKEATIMKLSNEISFLKTVKTEPLTFSNNAREVKSSISMRRLIAQIEELQRITRELTLRKTSAEEQLAEERERCHYYKTEYRKVYENYLLKNAESIAYSEQLSELEQETSRERGTTEGKGGNILQQEKDQFENLSSKFNIVARNHQHRYESSEEEEHIGKKKDYYSIQNVYLVDRSDIDLTLQNDRKLIIGNLCESAEHSPAKAVLNEHSSQIEEFAFELEEIKLKEAANQGQYTERLLLSELMQTSRRQNSLTQFQLIFSEHSEQGLELAGRAKQLAIHQQQTIIVMHQVKRCVIEQCYASIIFPREKREVSVGCDLECIDAEMQVQASTDDCGTMCSPTLSDAATSTGIETVQVQTNTVQKQTAELGVGEKVSIAQFGFSSWVTSADYGFSSQISTEEVGASITTITDTSSTNTPHIDTQHAQVQTLTIQQPCATQVEVEQRQYAHFQMFHQQIRKSNLQLRQQFTLSIDAQPINLAKNTLCSALLSHFVQPTSTKRGLFEPSAHKKDKKMPKLNLSFLQSSRGNEEEEEIFDDDHQSDFQSFSSFTSIRQTEETQQAKESINLNQMHSGRTRSSSQELNSQRSEKAENEKKGTKARVKNPIKESMISENSSCSEQSVRKQASKATCAKQHKTAQQTPAVDCKNKARQSPQSEKQSQLFSKKELSVIKDYFYLLQSMEQVQEFTLTSKQNHIEKYDFHHNMYAFRAEKGGRIDKFVVWRGKVIRFGPKSEFIELVNYAQSCKTFKGSYVSLGNCEFRIVEDRLQIHRLNKRRCFKGEMENGEWQIQKIWTFATN